MKYVLIILSVTFLSGWVCKYFFASDLPPEFVAKVQHQRNPFAVHKDSAELIWQRAQEFLHERRRLIAGSDMRKSDSLIVIPYGTSYEKGNSVRLTRASNGDSVLFTCYWWYSRMDQDDAEKEMALYMQTGEGRYNFKQQ